MQQVLDGMRRSYGAIGAMALVADGAGRRSFTSGVADRRGTRIGDATRFRIASITKPIVATLVLQEVAAGRLRLDDVVGRLLPGLLRVSPAITVRQLLNHTSGIFDEEFGGSWSVDAAKLTNPTLRAEAQDTISRYRAGQSVIMPDRVLVAMAETHPRYFTPDGGYRYCNLGYVLLAMVLEKVTGRSLATLIESRIVQPLALRHTTITPPDLRSPEFRGYMPGSGGQVDVTDRLYQFANGGSCGVITTAGELLTIMQAIVTGRLLPADLADQMRTIYRNNYGFGLEAYPSAFSCGTFWGHTGGVNGTLSVVTVSVDGSHAAVIALNIWSSSADKHLEAYAARMVCPASA